MKKLMLVLVLVFCTTARADKFTDIDADIIKAAGIPIYVAAVFAMGNKDVGFRFATADAPDKVKQWYREQLANWSLFESYGAWILYDGKAGAGMSDIMATNQVAVQQNENLPEWHSLPKDMTTEIVIMVVK
jgi:hypothetical protein